MGGAHQHNMREAFFNKAAKAQVPIAAVSFLVCIVMFVFTFVQSTDDDSDRCVTAHKDSIIQDFREFLNPYVITWGSHTPEEYQCGWPSANTAFRATILALLAATNVVHVLMRMAVISDRYVLVLAFGYFLWMLLMFAVFCVDCSSIRVGAGMCSKRQDKHDSVSACSSGRFIGLALGDLLLSATAYVLFKIPVSKKSADPPGETASAPNDAPLPVTSAAADPNDAVLPIEALSRREVRDNPFLG